MIPYGRHSINDDDIAAVAAALKSDWLTTGPLVEAFETALEKVVGAPCISVNSGTSALHCAYAAIGLGPGDEVITPPITFIATQATAAFFGATIVFADVQPDTANIDPQAVAAVITPRTKAIVAVDYAGHPADLDELRVIANRHGIYLIEDAAHSLGSFFNGEPVGSQADVTTFSFFATKNITTGEGGAVSSPDKVILRRAKEFSRQGLVRDPSRFINPPPGPWHQEVHEFGLNYRLTDFQCALGITQLSRIEEIKKERTGVKFFYDSAFEKNTSIRKISFDSNSDPMWHLYPIFVKDRTRVFKALRDKGIGVQVNYVPANQHPVFTKLGYKPQNLPNSEKFYSQEISLPMYKGLSHSTLDKIVKSVEDSL